MAKYILRRCLFIIVVAIAAAFVIFTVLYFKPGDPAASILGASASQAELDAKTVALGLDKSYLQQLGSFLSSFFLRFDFGTSWKLDVPVMSVVLERLPRTAVIGVGSILLTFLIGIPVGLFAGLHQGKWQDSLVMGLAMMCVSLPDFWVALMMVVLFSVKLNLLPGYGIGSWQCYVMPIIAGAFGGLASLSRLMRSSLLEVFRADYITTARAKGVSERKVIFRHMFPNALLPIITTLGGSFTRIIAGSAIIESVFSIPGIGLYLLEGIKNNDYPVVRGCVLMLAIFTALAMLLTDLMYAFVDPRIKAQYMKGGK